MKNDNDYNVIVPLNPSDFPEYNDVLKYICNESQDKNIDVTDQQIVERGWEFYESGDLQWTDRTDKNPSPVELFFLNWLPYYLMKTGQKEKAAQALTDFSFLMQRLRYGAVERVVLDYILFEKELSAVSPQCAAYMDVVRSASHLLRRDRAKNPAYKIMLQVAMGIADDCPVTQAAQRWLTPENSDSPCDWFWMSKVNRPKEYHPSPIKIIIEKNMGNSVKIHPNGDVISIGEGDNRFFDGHRNYWGVDFDNKKNRIRIWDIETGVCKAVLEGHTDMVRSVRILKSGDIFSFSDDNTMRNWSSDGVCKAVLKGHDKKISGVSIMRSGDILSWSNDDKTIRIWSPDGVCKTVIEAVADWVIELQSGDILSWEWDNSLIHIWSPDGTRKTTLESPDNRVHSVLELRSGDILSWYYNVLYLWSPDGVCKAILEGHTDGIKGVLELLSGDILSWGTDNTLRIWSPDGSCKAILKGHTDWVTEAMELKSGDILSWSWRDDKTIRLWSPDGACKATLEGHTDDVRGVLELRSGDFLSWEGIDNVLRLWSPDGECKAVIDGYADDIYDIKELPSGDILLWGSDKTLCVISLNIACKTPLDGHSNMVNGIMELKSGDVLSWSRDHTLRIWTPDGITKAVLKGHTDYVLKAMELRSGDILSLSTDKSMRLWSPDGVCKAVFGGHPGGRLFSALELQSGDILSWNWFRPMRLWSPDGVCKAILKVPFYEREDDSKSGNIFSRIWNRLFRSRKPESDNYIGLEDQMFGAIELKSGDILTWSSDNVLRIWSSKGRYKASFSGHSREIDSALELKPGVILSWDYEESRVWSVKGVCKAVLEGAYNPEAKELPSGEILLRLKDGYLYILSSDGECKKEIKNDDPQFDSYNALFQNNQPHETLDIEIEEIGDSDEHSRRFNKKPIAQWNCIGRGPSLLSAGRLYIHYGSCNRVDFLKLNYGSHQSVSFEQAKQFLNGDIKESDFVSYVPKSTN